MSAQNRFLLRVILGTLVLLAPPLLAEKTLVFQKRRPFQVTGQLSPFRFLVDGELLFERPRSYIEIKVNGVKVKLQGQTGRLFAFETDQESINVEASTWNDINDTFKLKPGKIKEAKYDGEQLIFKIDGHVARATIDGADVILSGEKVEWHPGKGLHDPHKLVLYGEGRVPASHIDFQMVSPAEFKKLMAQKKREDSRNPNRLIASEKPSWLSKVEWRYAELDLGLRFGENSGFGLSAAMAPQYAYGKVWGLKGLAGLAALDTPSGLAVGGKLGLHVTHALSALPLTLELGPTLYLLSKGQAFAATIDLAGAYSFAGMVAFVHAAGLGYAFWITPRAHQLRAFVEFKF